MPVLKISGVQNKSDLVWQIQLLTFRDKNPPSPHNTISLLLASINIKPNQSLKSILFLSL